MKYHTPHPAINHYVRTIITGEGHRSALPVLPYGMPALVFMKENDVRGDSAIWLIDSLNVKLLPNAPFIVTACFFRPFVVHALFDIQANGLSDRPIALEKLVPERVASLREKLTGETITNGRIAIINEFLQEQIRLRGRACNIVRMATDRMVNTGGNISIASILQELNISERMLQRLFRKYIGATPGRFLQICRFQSAFHQLRNGTYTKLTELAYDHGYADQSHFNRSFRAFTGVSPNGYVKRGLMLANIY